MSCIEDPEVIAELVKALGRQRGYASFFDWPDRQVKERGIVFDFLNAVPHEFAVPIQSVESCEQDPPDCVVVDAVSGRIGVEVTEFVDQAALETAVLMRNSGVYPPWAQWDAGKVVERLRQIISTKGTPHRVFGGPFDEYILLIHTAEPGLKPKPVAAWLDGVDLGSPGILSRAYLMFDYRPAPIEGHPIVRLA